MLYVENTYGGDITIVDTARFEVVGTIPVDVEGGHPDDVVGTKDGRILYCNVATETGHFHPLCCGETSWLIAYDTATRKEIWRTSIQGHIGHMTISPDDKYVYMALFSRWYVARVDTATHEVSYIPVSFNGGHGIRVSPDGQRLYVGSILMAKLDIIDLAEGKIRQSVLFRDNVRPFDLTKDERTLYVQTSWMHGFHVVDIPTNRILKTVALPQLPPETPRIEAFPHTVDHGLELTPDGTRMVCLGTTGDHAAIYSVPDLTLLGTIPLGGEPNWVIVDAEGKYAYASNRKTDDVSVISIADLREVARVKVGRFPQRMWIG